MRGLLRKGEGCMGGGGERLTDSPREVDLVDVVGVGLLERRDPASVAPGEVKVPEKSHSKHDVAWAGGPGLAAVGVMGA